MVFVSREGDNPWYLFSVEEREEVILGIWWFDSFWFCTYSFCAYLIHFYYYIRIVCTIFSCCIATEPDTTSYRTCYRIATEPDTTRKKCLLHFWILQYLLPILNYFSYYRSFSFGSSFVWKRKIVFHTIEAEFVIRSSVEFHSYGKLGKNSRLWKKPKWIYDQLLCIQFAWNFSLRNNLPLRNSQSSRNIKDFLSKKLYHFLSKIIKHFVLSNIITFLLYLRLYFLQKTFELFITILINWSISVSVGKL